MEQRMKKVLSQLSIPAGEWVGLRFHQEESRTREVRDGNPKANSSSQQAGVMVEWFVNGHFGYAATANTSEQNLFCTALKAREQAAAASKMALFRFEHSCRPPAQGRYATEVKSDFDAFSEADYFDLLVNLSRRIRTSDAIVTTLLQLDTSNVHSCYVSSNGANFDQKFSFISVAMEAIAQKNGIVQRRSNHGLRGSSYQGGSEFLVRENLNWQADNVAIQIHELLDAQECPTEATNLVLAPDQMMLQIHESIGHPLELDRILGDERNYAGSSFVKRENFGNLRYGSELLNVTFDPTVKHQFASYAFDDCGNPAKREFLIEKGILKRGLGSLESQARSGVAGVANQRSCSWNRPPIDRMANINVEPGVTSFEQIISNIERGVYMESNRSWSIDDYRNKFQFGCEYARLIENGKLGRVLRNPNYRGKTSEFWTKLTAVGDSSTLGIFGTPYCGKGEPNQIIRVGHASPVCAFSNVEVFGGA